MHVAVRLQENDVSFDGISMAGVLKSQGSTPAAASTVLDKEARERERGENWREGGESGRKW